jgi:Sec-independent protein secretion pathway component TatC
VELNISYIYDFYSMIITLMAGTGLLYTAPVFVVLLVQVGILPTDLISGKRKMIARASLSGVCGDGDIGARYICRKEC